MNKNFQKINIENVLFFNIATASKYHSNSVPSLEVYRLYEKLGADESPLSLYIQKAPITMCYNKVVCVCVSYIKNGVVYMKSIEGEENFIIESFCKISNSFEYICGNSILSFGLPTIINNGYRYFNVANLLPDRFVTSGKKIWNLDKVLDLQEIFKGTYYYNNSFEELCAHFDLESIGNIPIHKVSEEYWNGNKDALFLDCKNRLLQCINLFRKMRWEVLFKDYEDKSVVYASEEKKSLLQTIIDSKSIPKDLSVFKDVENAETILLAAVINLGDPDYGIGKDTKEEIENKKLLINKALNFED